ncbi:MAG TPA: hypothetical protein VGC78_13915 [Gaiellaceae bacterium]
MDPRSRHLSEAVEVDRLSAVVAPNPVGEPAQSRRRVDRVDEDRFADAEAFFHRVVR